jgi:hypothetical protein
MDVAYLTALSPIAGSVVGGLTAGITTWLSQRPGKGRASRPRDVAARRPLQGFIVAASKAYGDAVLSNEPQVPELVALAALISRMRLLSSPRTVASAEKIMEATISAYFAPNKTLRELHDLMKSGTGIDPLKAFSEAAREELRAFSPQ